jgi:predicted signal transduction protein with EAL and GGDEF domain
VLLPRLAESGHITTVVQKIRKALEEPFAIEKLPIAVEVSIGIAIYPDHGADAETLFQRADVAMYEAKRTGGGYAVYATELDHHSPRRLALMGALRQAIEQNQLRLHYQPKVSLTTGQAIGVEALVRWQHPEYGFIPPDQFIGPAEQTGLIGPLTQWVLNTALNSDRVWSQARKSLTVSMNLSARSLYDSRLPGQLEELMRIRGGSPERLELEITESAIMADPVRAMEILLKVHGMGIRFLIDDFGTGYSSLAYLKKLPVDAIKIDKAFVINMAKDPNDAVIVRSTIELGHNMGIKVVAEGVENQETYQRLIELGCDAAQGYYMGRPLPFADLNQWLDESPWGLKKA